MNNLLKSLVVFIIATMSSMAYGQEMKITGNVYDSTGVKPAVNAMVMAVRMSDSVLLGFTRTDNAGHFELKGFEIDTFSLVIDHPNFDPKTYYMFGHEDNAVIDIPAIRMPEKAQEIEEVVIYANKEPMYYRGDTLVYRADSFQTHEGAVVEDLLKKLPGIKVDKDGKITIGGEEISQVLVDGDEFFGDDPTIATKNLGADGIDEVKVYEKENDDGIGGDDEKIQVLDLTLKDNAKKGYFGRISGASDFALTNFIDGDGTFDFNKAFYEGEVLFNRFNGSQKVSVFALTTNTPTSNFALGDMSKFGLQNEDGANGRWWEDNTRNTSGIPQTFKAGVYFSDKIGKKKGTKIGFNYSYYNTKLDANSASRSQYYLTDTTYISDDSTRNYTANQSHRFNFNLESKLDSLTTLTIKPSFRYDMANSQSSNINNYFDRSGNQTIATNIDSKDESAGYQLNGKFALNRRFMKPKRELELRYDVDMSDNATESKFDSKTEYLLGGLPDTITNQEKVNNNSNLSHFGTVTYVEPLGKKFELELEYLYEHSFNDQEKESFDLGASGQYDSLRTDLSNVFENIRQQHRGGVELTYEITKKHSLMLGTRVRNVTIANNNLITGVDVNQNVSNILPRAEYKFSAGRGKRFTVEYRTSSDQPSITDLQPVVDNTNPNQIREGNPNIVPNYNHRIEATLRNFDVLTNKFIWAGANFTITDNAFADSTNYDIFGRTYTKRVNVDGNQFGFVYGGIYLPFLNRKIGVQPQLVANYFKTKSYISGQDNFTTNYGITPELKVDFNLLGDSMQVEVFGKYTYNHALTSINNIARPSSIQEYGASFVWQLPLGFKVGFDGTYTKNAQTGVGFNTEYFILNAEFSKRFLKTQNLEIGIKGNDILNQNVSARREVNGNIITDYRTQIISRYFLLKATLRFNNRKTREDDFQGMH